MLKIAKELTEAQGKSLFGLAPSGTALKELESKKIEAKTLQWFLEKYRGYAEGRGTAKGLLQRQEEYKDKILVVDEASMIGSHQMQYLLTIAKKFDLKITLIGDTKQLNAVEAGNPFYQMQKHGLKTVLMGDIVRQRNTRLKSAIYDVINASKSQNISKGYIKRAFSKIDNIIEVTLDDEKDSKIQEVKKYTRVSNKENIDKIQDKVKLTNKIAKETADTYCKLSPEERNNTILLTLSNKSRVRVNTEIRKNLKESGELIKNSSTKKEVLANKGLEDELKRNINSYRKGDILRFNKSLKSGRSDKLNIVKGRYYQVFDRDIKNNHIYLTELKENKKYEPIVTKIKNKLASLFISTNKTVIFNPSKMGSRKSSVEVYSKEQKEFLIGEKINFTRGFINKGINNSMSAVIKDITPKGIIIKTENNKELTIKNNDNIIKHIDYGYAFTANRAQGTTYNNVIAVLESYHSELTSQKPFYVEISRARENVTLILDLFQN